MRVQVEKKNGDIITVVFIIRSKSLWLPVAKQS